MSEYRMEFDDTFQPGEEGSDGLEHYRFEIAKLREKLREDGNIYKKRIAELENEVYSTNRRPITATQKSESKPAKVQQNLSYELYEKDLQIRELKAENVKLRQIINNPDKVLIRRPDHFEAITEKEQEIIKLRKTIQELEGKHDGQYLGQQKLKKENEMLLHEIEQLQLELKKQNKTRFGFNEETLDPELMEALRYKKELEVSRKEVATLEGVIRTKDEEIGVWRNKYNAKNNFGLGYTTQLEDLKLELGEYKDKSRELNKVVLKLQEENQKLLDERNIARISAEQRVPEVARKSKNDAEKTENLMRFHQSRSVAMQSLVPAPEKPLVRRTDRYDQFHFSDWESVME
jgi:chromosome segregation ATPase